MAECGPMWSQWRPLENNFSATNEACNMLPSHHNSWRKEQTCYLMFQLSISLEQWPMYSMFHVSFILNDIFCTTICTLCLQYVILSPIMQLRNHMQSLQSGIEYPVPPKLTLHLYTMYILFLPSYWRYVVFMPIYSNAFIMSHNFMVLLFLCVLCIFMCCTLLCNM